MGSGGRQCSITEAPAAQARRSDGSRRLVAGLVATLGVAALGCHGMIADPGEEPFDTGIATGSDYQPPTPDQCVADATTAIGPADPWRLTVRDYVATVTDLLGGHEVANLSRELPVDVGYEGFDNQTAALTLSADQALGFRAAAELVAEEVTANSALRRAVMGCDVEMGDRDGCLTAFVARFGRRAYRRPLTGDPSSPAPDSEIGRLLAMAQGLKAQADAEGASLYGGHIDVAAVVAALLQSPNFLFRITAGLPDAADPARQRLSGYEVATRLSYLVWGVGPDDALLDAAATGTLDAVGGIEGEVRRMLADPRAQSHLWDFFHQWLGLGLIRSNSLDPDVFPIFGPALQESMYGEVRRLIEDHAFVDGVDLMGMWTASYGYSDRELATIYGAGAPADGQLAPFEHAQGQRRAGILTTAGMLAMTSHPSAASIVGRGLLVREQVLCDDIPAPPPNVPDLPPGSGDDQARLLDQHTADPVCAGCHRQIDPIGNGLEIYDAIGGRNDRGEADVAALERYVEGIENSVFLGGDELGALVADQPATRQCVVDRFFRWSMGREPAGVVDTQSCTGAVLTERFRASGNSLLELVVALATSDEMRFKVAPVCD